MWRPPPALPIRLRHPCRLKDAADLEAAVLSRLRAPDPLAACWPLLAAEGALGHPRWLQLGARVLEAAAHAGPAARREPLWREVAEQLIQVGGLVLGYGVGI